MCRLAPAALRLVLSGGLARALPRGTEAVLGKIGRTELGFPEGRVGTGRKIGALSLSYMSVPGRFAEC
jgi:hypothetical protein